jgi:hypothetical protein
MILAGYLPTLMILAGYLPTLMRKEGRGQTYDQRRRREKNASRKTGELV